MVNAILCELPYGQVGQVLNAVESRVIRVRFRLKSVMFVAFVPMDFCFWLFGHDIRDQ